MSSAFWIAFLLSEIIFDLLSLSAMKLSNCSLIFSLFSVLLISSWRSDWYSASSKYSTYLLYSQRSLYKLALAYLTLSIKSEGTAFPSLIHELILFLSSFVKDLLFDTCFDTASLCDCPLFHPTAFLYNAGSCFLSALSVLSEIALPDVIALWILSLIFPLAFELLRRLIIEELLAYFSL